MNVGGRCEEWAEKGEMKVGRMCCVRVGGGGRGKGGGGGEK